MSPKTSQFVLAEEDLTLTYKVGEWESANFHPWYLLVTSLNKCESRGQLKIEALELIW